MSWWRACLLLALLWPCLAEAGWDPLQKAERAAARGARLLAAGDSLAAVDAFLEAQALAPDNPSIRNGLAEALYANGEFNSALGQYRSVVRESAPASPRQLDASYNAGNAAFAAGEYETALEHYTEALLAGSQDADLLHNLELAQKLLEAAQSQPSQEQEGGENQEGQEQQEGEQQQPDQQSGEEQSPEQQEEHEREQEREAQPDSAAAQEQQPPSAAPDSTEMEPQPAASDSLRTSMSVAEALRLLDALDHDEEELRKSILRRLRGETEQAGDW